MVLRAGGGCGYWWKRHSGDASVVAKNGLNRIDDCWSDCPENEYEKEEIAVALLRPWIGVGGAENGCPGRDRPEIAGAQRA